MTNAHPDRAGTFTGRHMLWLTLAFFSVVVVVNLAMAFVASSSWTGLVVENSYVASQEFEQKRIAHQQQQAAGWQAEFRYAPGTAEFTLHDAAGAPVDLGEVTLLVNRPVGGHDDRRLALQRQPDGGYAAPLDLPPGIWDALVTAAATPKGPFELHERFAVEGGTR